jgi:hypothetical protein
MKTYFLVFLGLSLSLYGQDSTKTLEIVQKPIWLEKKGFKMQIPDGWRISTECSDVLCSLLAPIDTLSRPDIYVENINFTVDKLPSASYTVDQYASFSIKYLPSVVKNFKLLSKKKLGPNAYLIEYQGLKSNFYQSWKQYYYTKNSKVYIVTLASETIKFDYYKKLTESSLKSFKLF